MSVLLDFTLIIRQRSVKQCSVHKHNKAGRHKEKYYTVSQPGPRRIIERWVDLRNEGWNFSRQRGEGRMLQEEDTACESVPRQAAVADSLKLAKVKSTF